MADLQFFRAQGVCTLWFTGLPGAGKSTLADALHVELLAGGLPSIRLDGDQLRTGLNADLGFGLEHRRENVRRAAEVAKLFNGTGFIVLASFVSPVAADRCLVRQIVGRGRYVEIHVDAPLATCEARDPKGLYRQARQGQIDHFTGVSAAYEVPSGPDVLRVDAASCGPAASIAALLPALAALGRSRNTPNNPQIR